MRKFLMSRGNPGPYVDASTALFTNEAMGGKMESTVRIELKSELYNHMIQVGLQPKFHPASHYS